MRAGRLARDLSRRARRRSTRPAGRASRPSAAAVARIVAQGEPVYGINTGFGKLASVRIAAGDLATLQRNIVLSHAAGVGEPMPVAVARLMMALKLASLAQGASGVRPRDDRAARGDAGAAASSRWSRRKARSARRAIWRRSRTWRRR